MKMNFYRDVVTRQTRGQRLGQAVWNTATDVYPGVVEDLRDTHLDPFYNDSAVSDFLQELAGRLDRQS